MSWARGVDKNGREIGYAVEATCDLDGCEEQIDRGLSFKCGGVTSLHESDYGCGRFVCAAHMYGGQRDQLCEDCVEKDPICECECHDPPPTGWSSEKCCPDCGASLIDFKGD